MERAAHLAGAFLFGAAAVYLSVSTSAAMIRANATPPTEAQMAALADLRARAERRAAEDVMGSFASRESREQAGRRGGV